MTYTYIANASTVVCKTGSGKLYGIIVNSTASGTITVYNDITAVATNKIATIKASVAEGTFNYLGVPFSTGLTVVTAAASDITVIYS